MSDDLRIARLVQTCIACPSQWEGEMLDGRSVYIRCRHGELTVRFGPAGSGTKGALANAPAFDIDVGRRDYDGWIELDEVCAFTGLVAPDART